MCMALKISMSAYTCMMEMQICFPLECTTFGFIQLQGLSVGLLHSCVPSYE
jgi:hypothetical protein